MKSGYIAVVGPPNSGKSTLINHILQEKLAAVTSKPQTTRKRFLGIYSRGDCQMLFIDTPGFHQSEKKLNKLMIQEVWKSMEDCDVICFVFSVDQGLEDLFLRMIDETLSKFLDKKFIFLVSKIDLKGSDKKLNLDALKLAVKNRTNKFIIEFLEVSASKNIGLENLLSTIKECLPEGPCYYPADQLTDLNLREIVPEIIREKAMDLLHQEIPYSLAVTVGSFKEDDVHAVISAELIVEHSSQKGIVIGEKGSMIKNIGVQARRAIEVLLSKKVRLELFVKVDKNWTKNPKKLIQYGYSEF